MPLRHLADHACNPSTVSLSEYRLTCCGPRPNCCLRMSPTVILLLAATVSARLAMAAASPEARTSRIDLPEKLSFVTTPEAGERSAVIYTLLGSCQRHGINPFDYLNDLFTRLPAAKITQIKEFTPAAWAKAKGKLLAQAA